MNWYTEKKMVMKKPNATYFVVTVQIGSLFALWLVGCYPLLMSVICILACKVHLVVKYTRQLGQIEVESRSHHTQSLFGTTPRQLPQTALVRMFWSIGVRLLHSYLPKLITQRHKGENQLLIQLDETRQVWMFCMFNSCSAMCVYNFLPDPTVSKTCRLVYLETVDVIGLVQ